MRAPSPLLRGLSITALVVLTGLAGCASSPRGGGGSAAPGTDGPLPHPPADLEQVPDAQPRVEAVRAGGPNKPYEVDGRRYEPAVGDPPIKERGLASWYGRKFQGRPTASGEPYDMYAMTAAHPTMPLPSYARVRNPANGLEVVVRINDRGPFHSGRIIDLSYTAALKLRLLRGVGIVEVERLTNDDIRTGVWKRGADGTQLTATAKEASTPPDPPASPPAPSAATSSASAPAPSSAKPSPDASAPGDATVVAVADAPAAPEGRYWLQLGAFRQRDGAVGFQQRVATTLDWLAPQLVVIADAALHRLQAGPYPSRAEAQRTAERIRAGIDLVPVVVERASAPSTTTAPPASPPTSR